MPLFPSLTGMQSFMRAANAYGPQPQPEQQQPIQTDPLPMIRTPQESVQDMPTTPWNYDENVTAQVGPEPDNRDIIDEWKKNVLNFPESRPTTPKTALNTYRSALQVASTPTDYEKNRVFIDGNAYQKARVYTNKATGQKQYIEPYKQPGFGEQVLKSMAGADIGSQTADILNQPGEDAMADWKAKNEAYGKYATQENLDAYRTSQAANAGVRAGAAATTAGARVMDAQTRARLGSLHNLTDEQRLQMLQDGKVSIEELRQADRLALEDRKQTGREQLEKVKQGGRIDLAKLKDMDDEDLENLKHDNRINEEDKKEINREQLARLRGEQGRETKRTPSGSAGATAQLPSQQKVAHQNTMNQAVIDHPEWKKWMSIDQNGQVQIEEPSWKWGSPSQDDYDAMRAYMRGEQPPSKKTGGSPAPISNNQQQPAPPAKAPGSPQMPAPLYGQGATPRPKEPTGPPQAGNVYVEDLQGNFVGEIPAADAQRLNATKYRVRK